MRLKLSMSFSFEDLPSAIQVLFLCFLVCVFLTGKAIWQHSFCKLPPGPWGIPLIGETTFLYIPSLKNFTF